MIVFDKSGYEHKISISKKLKFEQFKKDFKHLDLDFEIVYEQLTDKKIGKPDRNTISTKKDGKS